jgi:uncharacterized protein (TIGR02231 family)
MQMQMPMQAMMPPPGMSNAMLPERRLSCDADELDFDLSAGEEDDGGITSSTTVAGASGGSSTFHIERRTAIASDAKEHKVCVAMIELQPEFRHFCTPSLEPMAYLQVRAVNSSLYPLLASSKASVFFDGSFVCTTALKMIYPGESFSVFLGTDSTVKVQHKLVDKSTNEGAAATFMSKKQNSKQVFEYVTQLHNTKAEEAIDITVVELLPRSEDESIKVHVISPPQSLLATTTIQASAADGGTLSSGEGQLKPGAAMKNKITNNVVFAKSLAPQEKLDISFSFSVEWPHDKDVEIA